MRFYDRALALNAGHFRARLARARTAYHLGDHPAAPAVAVADKSPRDLIAVFIRAQEAAQLGGFAQARAALEDARAIVSTVSDEFLLTDPPRLQIAGVVNYLTGDLDRAGVYLDHFLRLKPQHYDMRRLLGMIQLKLGDANGAISNLRPLLKVFKDDPDILTGLG